MCAVYMCHVSACASSLYMCLNVNMWKCVFLSVNERCVCAYTQMCISLCVFCMYVVMLILCVHWATEGPDIWSNMIPCVSTRSVSGGDQCWSQ